MSTASLALNASAHTLTDLKTFAQQAPTEAEQYLRQVAGRLKASGQTAGADIIAALLNATGSLVERIDANAAQLGQLFPANAGDWAQLQAARAGAVGWAAPPPAGALTYLKGTVANDGGRFKLTTPGGRVFELAESPKVPNVWMARMLMQGVMGDGPLNLQGELEQDGKTFVVEGFALNRDGHYDTFTYARVNVVGDQVNLSTPRGFVEISDPAFKAKMKAMPRLGVILPGEPLERADGVREYEGNPDRFFGLARFRELTVHPADAAHPAPFTNADMAYSSFNNKPVTIPPGSEARVNHNGRLWVEGDVKLDAAGVAQSWVSTYVGIQADNVAGVTGVPGTAADAAEAAILTTDAGV